MNNLNAGDSRHKLTQAERILVLGCCGSGKSKLATELSILLNLPLIKLDDVYWGPNWTRPAEQEWLRKVESIATGSKWIVDGNYLDSLGPRLARAEVTIVFDLPTWVCLWSTISRDLRRVFGDQEDLPRAIRLEGGSGFGQLWLFVLTFRRRVRPRMWEMLSTWEGKPYILRTRKDAERLLKFLHRDASSGGFA